MKGTGKYFLTGCLLGVAFLMAGCGSGKAPAARDTVPERKDTVENGMVPEQDDAKEETDSTDASLSDLNLEEAIAEIKDEKYWDEAEMTLTEQTVLEDGRACLKFDAVSTYETCIKSASVTAYFEFFDEKWNLLDVTEDNVEMDFSPLVGVTYTSDFVLHEEIRFLALDEENKTVTLEYYVGDNFAWQEEKPFQELTLKYVVVDGIMYIERFYDVREYAYKSDADYYGIELWINAHHNKGMIHDDAKGNRSGDPSYGGVSGEMIEKYY